VVGGDGQEGPSFPLVGDQIDIGRSEGSVVLPDDKYMSPRHARILRVNGNWQLRDLDSTNRIFFRLREPHELVDGDLLLLGVEVLRFELAMDAELGLGPAVQHGTLVFGSPALPRPARLVQRTVEGVARDVYHLHRLETVIGRESGDIVFTDDPYMSRRHATIRRSTASGSMTLVDLNSSNGTFVAIRGDCVLQDGDSIRVGQHLFRVELAPG
jgi:pSer/pThr/pTyr-binding forkhead associated (FHA) protein